jgi:tetratricopeptide (TPR) repeat protein
MAATSWAILGRGTVFGGAGVLAALLAGVLAQQLYPAGADTRRQLEAALEEKAALVRQLDTAREWASGVVAQAERQQAGCREAREEAADAEREIRELRWHLRAAGAYAPDNAGERTALPAGRRAVPSRLGADGCEVCAPAAPPRGAVSRLDDGGTTMLSGVAKETLIPPPAGAARPTGADDVTVSVTVRHAGGEAARHARVELPLHLAGDRLGLRGLPLALSSMAVGERARFLFAPELGYGPRGDPGRGVPPASTVEAGIELHAVAEVEDLSTDGDRSVLKRVLTPGKGSETPGTGATVTVRLGTPGLQDLSLVPAAAALAGVGEGEGAAAGTVALRVDDSRAVGEALRLALHAMRRGEVALITLSPQEARLEPLLASASPNAALAAQPVVATVELVSFRQARDVTAPRGGEAKPKDSAAKPAAVGAKAVGAGSATAADSTGAESAGAGAGTGGSGGVPGKGQLDAAQQGTSTGAVGAGAGGVGAGSTGAIADAHSLKGEGNRLFGIGRRDEACAVYGRALAALPPLHPTAAGAPPEASVAVALHNNLANCALLAGQPAEALGHANASLSLDPASAKGLYRRAQALDALGRVREAEVAAAAALRQAPASAPVRQLHEALVGRLASAGESGTGAGPVGAAELLAAAGEIKDRANGLFSDGRREEACTEYARGMALLESSPASADAALSTLATALRNNLANCALLAGRPAEALGHADAALHRTPGSAKALYRRAQALHALGRRAEAQAAVALAHASNPSNDDVAKLRAAIDVAPGGALGRA